MSAKNILSESLSSAVCIFSAPLPDISLPLSVGKKERRKFRSSDIFVTVAAAAFRTDHFTVLEP